MALPTPKEQPRKEDSGGEVLCPELAVDKGPALPTHEVIGRMARTSE